MLKLPRMHNHAAIGHPLTTHFHGLSAGIEHVVNSLQIEIHGMISDYRREPRSENRSTIYLARSRIGFMLQLALKFRELSFG